MSGIQKKRQFVCSICQKKCENKAALSNHFKCCRAKHQREVALKNGELTCDFGCGKVAHYQFKSGNVCCSKYTSNCSAMREKNSLGNKGRKYNWKNGHPKGMTGKAPWNKGLTIDDYPAVLGEKKAVAYREKVRKGLQGKNSWAKMSEYDREAAKQKLKISIRHRYDEGWMPKAGRCKKICYESPVCGKVSLDGFWELLVAIYFDSLHLRWIRNTRRFDYINSKGKNAKYTPNFYVEDWDTYIEVIGI